MLRCEWPRVGDFPRLDLHGPGASGLHPALSGEISLGNSTDCLKDKPYVQLTMVDLCLIYGESTIFGEWLING